MYGCPHPHVSDTDRLKVDHNHPEVAQDLLSWGPWVLQVRLPNDISGQALLPETQNEHTDNWWKRIQTRCDQTHGSKIPPTIRRFL